MTNQPPLTEPPPPFWVSADSLLNGERAFVVAGTAFPNVTPAGYIRPYVQLVTQLIEVLLIFLARMVGVWIGSPVGLIMTVIMVCSECFQALFASLRIYRTKSNSK